MYFLPLPSCESKAYQTISKCPPAPTHTQSCTQELIISFLCKSEQESLVWPIPLKILAIILHLGCVLCLPAQHLSPIFLSLTEDP